MSQLFLEVIYSLVRLLNHNFLTVHDVDALCRSCYFLTLEVVDLTSLVVGVDTFDTSQVRSLVEQGDVDYIALAVDFEAHGNLELECALNIIVREGEELCVVFIYEYTI